MVKVKQKRASGRRNAPWFKGEDFVPWVPTDTEGPQDLEEEELVERMTGVLDHYAARKRKRQVISSNESDLAQAAGSSLPASKGGSEMQAIVIPGSPEPRVTDQNEPAGVARTESKEADSAQSALQVIHPSYVSRPGRSKFMRSGIPRPPLPEWIITNSYAPLREPEPPKVEVTALGADEVKFIMRRLEPFHCGEAVADREQLVSAYVSDAGGCPGHGS